MPTNPPIHSSSPSFILDESGLEVQIQVANDLIREGQWAKAKFKYEEIIEIFGESENLLMPLGLLEGQLGSLDRALECFKKITEKEVLHFNAWMAAGLCEKNLHQYCNAINSYKQAKHALLLRLKSTKEPSTNDLLIECLVQLCELQRNLKQNDEALENAKLLLNIQNNPDSYQNLCRILLEINRFEDCLNLLNQAILQYPQAGQLYVLKGLTLEKLLQDRMQDVFRSEILNCYDRAIELSFEDLSDSKKIQSLVQFETKAQAYYFKANFLSTFGHWHHAISQYERVIELRPKHLMCLNNLMVANQSIGRNDRALYYLEQIEVLTAKEPVLIEKLQQDVVPFYFNAGALLLFASEFTKAKLYFEKALLINLHYPQLLSAYIHLRMRLCDWQSFAMVSEGSETKLLNFEQLKQCLLSGVQEQSILAHPFALLSLTDDASLQAKASKAWARIFEENEITQLPNSVDSDIFSQSESLVKSNREKIRLGYFSCDFKEHATAYLIASLFELHDRDDFEIYAYSWSLDDQSVLRERLKNSFDQWFEVGELADSQLIALAREHNLDIAFDLKGYTEGARTQIFASRVAPVQIAYLGYPGTMEASFIDFCIADEVVMPLTEQGLSKESVLLMPVSYQANDPRRQISKAITSRTIHGLPEEGIVFSCFNSAYKITYDIFTLWMDILRTFPSSVLWLLDDNETASENLLKIAESLAIPKERIVFAPKLPPAQHLERISHADLFLDTFPCNAHTSASDSLWSGVPLVTLSGKSFASKVAASLLTSIGYQDLITYNKDQYMNKIIELAKKPLLLRSMKEEILRRKKINDLSLFNAKKFVNDFENLIKSVKPSKPHNFV
jgi:predicted O-linked N-acetylglucosamine transferase (SPINDLY family)